MANITVKNSITVINNIVSVNFETDVANISKIELSKDGGNTFINSLNYSNNSASFDITDWENGTYTNCVLKLTFQDTSTPTTYTITINLTNCTSSNSANSITESSSYSSTITANFLPILSISEYICGNFCNVVIIIFLPSLMAFNKSLELLFLSIFSTVPAT